MHDDGIRGSVYMYIYYFDKTLIQFSDSVGFIKLVLSKCVQLLSHYVEIDVQNLQTSNQPNVCSLQAEYQ